MKKRILALILCLAMALSVLTGCSGNKKDDSTDSTSYGDFSASSGDSSASAALEAIPQAAREDVVSYLSDGALSSDTILMTVDGSDIPADYYFYWLGYYFNQMSSYYSYYGMEMDLTTPDADGNTMAASLQSLADQAVVSYSAMMLEAGRYGVSLTDEDKKRIDEYVAGQDELYCLFNGATNNALKRVNTDYLFYTSFGSALYGEGGEYEVTDEAVNAYVEEKGAYNCRYILCKVEDDDDEATEKAQKETAQSYYDELKKLSGEEQLNRFIELQGNNPDGNTDEFSFDASSSLTEGFRETLAKMEVGDIALSDKTGYGYFVIMRLAPDMEALREEYQSNDFAEKLEEMTENYKSENTPNYDKVDVGAILTRLQELQNTIVEAENGASAEDEEAEASGSAQ